jgi:tetratricopeptide (TPR) repeat protein/tRNA A-37 threonylcarbamoyl transferase component Bud32
VSEPDPPPRTLNTLPSPPQPPCAPAEATPPVAVSAATLAQGPAVPAPSGKSPPGYGIICELGRGGMGVVYKAKDHRLNRIVALKMILTGKHASSEELSRFLTEAESVAQLQHPNIVQIFESGQHDGLPFFTLEFVSGGNLADKVREHPLPPREAAAVLEQLARGVAYAHGQGVIHRDLKPENVLLAEDGTPKITDFGLAKRVESQEALTATGAVLGTPSYMAPEQAGGKRREIGPWTDVYALGAILYRLVTGRPPFQAATALDTLWQVREMEPAAPSQLQAKLPRDLETIVLKCLQKEPDKRYPSAESLAEDLHRFRIGLPVHARRVGSAERFWRWCKRNPAVATVSALALLLLVGSLIGMTGLYLRAEEDRLHAEEEREQANRLRAKAEEEQRRADRERNLANGFAAQANRQHQEAEKQRIEAEKQRGEAEKQRTAAKEQAERSQLVTRLMLGMFESSDPLGLNGFSFGLVNKTGEDLTSRDLLDRAAKVVASNAEAPPLVRAAILDTVGNVYRSRGQHDKAEELLGKALELRQASAAPPGELAASLHSLAWLRHEQGQYPTAVRLYREALRLRLAEPEPDPAAVANTRFNLAWVLTEMEQYDEAEQLFQQVVAARLQHFGAEHRETALAKMALAALYLDSERAAQALPLVKAAILTFERLGEDHNVIAAAGKFQEGVIAGMVFNDNARAEKLLRESLLLVRKGLGQRHMYVLLPLVQLAMTLEDGRKYKEAEACYREAMDIAGERVSLAHPKVLVIANGLARVLRRRGAAAEADKHYEAILAAHRKRFGPDDPFVADVLVEYAGHKHALKQYLRQEVLLQEAVDIYRKAGGQPRRRYGECLTALGLRRCRDRHYAAAEPYLREAVEAARDRYHRPHVKVVEALDNLADALLKQGQYDAEADRLLAEAESLLADLPAGAERKEAGYDVAVTRCCYLRDGKGLHAEAAAALEKYLADPPAPAWRAEEFAFQLARCVPVALQDASLAKDARAAAAERYGEWAVKMLRRAWEQGAANPGRWRSDRLLTPLADRADFNKLMDDIGAKG